MAEEPFTAGLISRNGIGHVLGFEAAEQSLLGFLRSFAPGPAARMGREGVRQLAQLGLHRAQSHGFSEISSLCLYAGLMMQLGVDFDNDPFLPWVRAALKKASPGSMITGEHYRAQALHASATDYLERVIGKELKHLRSALFRATHIRLDDLPAPGAGFAERMSRLLREIYPQRMEDAEKDAVEQLVASGQDGASESVTGKSLAVYVAICFTMGYGAFHDPRFPQLHEVRGNTESLFATLQAHLKQELRDWGWKKKG